MSVDTISSKGYEMKPRRSTRHPSQNLTDTDFADEIALISESLVNAQSLLQSLEQASNCVGLYLNEKKTEYINKCNNDSDFIIKTIQDKLLKISYISSSEKDFLTRKGKARAACNVMNKIWLSDLD